MEQIVSGRVVQKHFVRLARISNAPEKNTVINKFCVGDVSLHMQSAKRLMKYGRGDEHALLADF